MTTIEQIEQELERRVDHYQRFPLKHDIHRGRLYEQLYKSDRAPLRAISGLEKVRALGDRERHKAVSDLADAELQQIQTEWEK